MFHDISNFAKVAGGVAMNSLNNASYPIEVFISYSHEDKELKGKLDKYLTILKNQGKVTTWSDIEITPGDELKEEINKHLNSARIILLLVSVDFINSYWCYELEMKRAMQRHDKEEAQIIPIILRPLPSKWNENLCFGKLLCLPKDGRPVTSWADKDEAYANIIEGIEKAVDKITRAEVHDSKPIEDGSLLGESEEDYIFDEEDVIKSAEEAMREIKKLMSEYIPNFDDLFLDNFQDKLISELRNENLFRIKTARTFVFGQTRAGKTTTINYLLSNSIFPATGKLSCTRSLACGEHKGGLTFYDSPGVDDIPEPENVTRSALLLNQIDEGKIDKIRLIDITTKKEEGPSKYREVPYVEFEDEIIPSYYAQHKAEIIVKEFPLHIFQQWASDKFDFLVFIMNSSNGIRYSQQKLIRDLYLTRGREIKLFKVMNVWDGKYRENAEELDSSIKALFDESKRRLREDNIPDADKWFIIDSIHGSGIDKLVQAFADTLPVHVLKQLEQVVKDDYSHLIHRKIETLFLDYVAHVACLVAVFPVDYYIDKENLIEFAIKSLIVMAEFMFSTKRKKVSTKILDDMISKLKASKENIPRYSTVTKEVIIGYEEKPTGNLLIDIWRSITGTHETFAVIEKTQEREISEYSSGIGGIQAIELTTAIGLTLRTIYNRSDNLTEISDNVFKKEIVNSRSSIKQRNSIIESLRIAGRHANKRLGIKQDIYPSVRNSLE